MPGGGASHELIYTSIIMCNSVWVHQLIEKVNLYKLTFMRANEVYLITVISLLQILKPNFILEHCPKDTFQWLILLVEFYLLQIQVILMTI
jgi:hypothetical protein